MGDNILKLRVLALFVFGLKFFKPQQVKKQNKPNIKKKQNSGGKEEIWLQGVFEGGVCSLRGWKADEFLGCCFPFTSDTFQIGRGERKIDVYHHRMNKISVNKKKKRKRVSLPAGGQRGSR